MPLIDASGAAALKRFIKSAAAKGTAIVICELNEDGQEALRSLDVTVPVAASIAESVAQARAIVTP